MKDSLPFISLIVACRNEEKFIGKCLDSLILNDYPKQKLEILVIDGLSEDSTKEIVKRYAEKYYYLKVLDNPKKITASALNIGIKETKGEIVMKIDAHSTYEKDYISKCVKYLIECNADNVGGVLKALPRENTLTAKAIAFCLSSPFGAGASYFRIGSKKPRLGDAVAFGCYRKKIFDKIGLFDEKMSRSEDIELNLRLKKAGGKILLVPSIIGYYYPVSTFKSFLKHYFIDGAWITFPLKFGFRAFSWRHLVPLAFVSGLMGSALLSFFFPVFLHLFLFVVCLYFLANTYYSLKIVIREKDFRYLFLMPIVFSGRHLSYGFGSIFGFLKIFIPGPKISNEALVHGEQDVQYIGRTARYSETEFRYIKPLVCYKENNEDVSLIIPCKNEEKFIGKCLDSLISNDYPKDKLEILIVDGMSEDKTREIVQGYTARYSYVKLLDNPKKITPVALNIGIKEAKGEVIMKIDAHSIYEKDYISESVKSLIEYNADNIGGVLKALPRENTLIAKAIAFCLSSPFGVGTSFFRTGSKTPREVDTVAFGCYRKDVFEKIGFFDERMARSQDIELNLRLKKAGGKILLVPNIIAYYYPVSNFLAFLKHYFIDGAWITYPLKWRLKVFSLRHLIPLFFVLSLIGSLALSFFISVFFWLFLFIVFLYFLVNIYFSFQIVLREKDFRYLFLMPIVFSGRHLSYGLGSIFGFFEIFIPVIRIAKPSQQSELLSP